MGNKWFRGTVRTLGWLAALTALLGVGLHIRDVQSRPAVLLASGAPYLMCAALLALALFLVGRSWLSSAGAALLVAAGAWTQLPAFVADGAQPAGPVLTVLQTNVLFGGADANAVVREVKSNNVDVMTVDELTAQMVTALRGAGLDEALPHFYAEPAPWGSGTGIWSRYPLRDTKKYDGFTMHQVSATMAHPQLGDVGVYAFHPLPPVFGVDTWQSELRRIDDILGAETRPAVVGADFNATRDHAAFRQLLRGRFADAADQAGAGLLRTYPTDKTYKGITGTRLLPPLIGIDYVLVAHGAGEAVRTVDIPGSDHRAILARLRMAG